MNAELSKYLRTIGARGGKSGSGDAKRRSRAHYRKAALARWGMAKAAK